MTQNILLVALGGAVGSVCRYLLSWMNSTFYPWGTFAVNILGSLLGMIPFFVGDIIDIFHRANTKNMQMIQGFVDGDEVVIKQVNQRAWQSAIVLFILLLLIALMVDGRGLVPDILAYGTCNTCCKNTNDFETQTNLQKILHLRIANPEKHCLWIPYREWLKTA